jgi:hypothetical protein
MAKTHTQWTVLAHGSIEEIADGVWRVEGTLPSAAMKRVMTVARRADGALVVHNAIALGEDAMKSLDALGRVGWLLVPNGYHRLDAATFAARYPEARVLCPRGARAKVEEVVAVHGDYGDFLADARVRLEHVDGTKDREGAMIVTSNDGATVVLNDLVFNMPHGSGMTGFILRMLGSSGGPRVTRIARMLVVDDKSAVRAHLERLAATPNLARVVVSHHDMIADRAAETL